MPSYRVTLGVGLLVGLERGWRDRDLPEGGRVAGLRTFALIGFLGGLLALLAISLIAAARLIARSAPTSTILRLATGTGASGSMRAPGTQARPKPIASSGMSRATLCS